ncbi:protein of unknown function [Methylorubrum extorquens]|uniref:Uncharacterized protein n=1 Tax=Methylorubrum extorquens TaxID=408 RepID=A0A2N9AYX4_METEX|nr:protein of unknown function [Methylorubrum extorquens]
MCSAKTADVFHPQNETTSELYTMAIMPRRNTSADFVSKRTLVIPNAPVRYCLDQCE